ncbi:MAG: hypothetical protein V7K55_24065 [Nostoc sp.]|uniref:hypothetical protein n=1 Tax=Nostoc sp. TaxID=1180 RepID=UPI002FFA2F08
MDVANDKYHVVMKPCNGGNSGQYFHKNNLRGLGGGNYLVNFLSDYTGDNFCMDIDDNSYNVVMRKCDRNTGQSFANLNLFRQDLDNNYAFAFHVTNTDF